MLARLPQGYREGYQTETSVRFFGEGDEGFFGVSTSGSIQTATKTRGRGKKEI